MLEVEASCEKKLHSSAWSWLLPPQLSCWKTPFTHSADQERHRRSACGRELPAAVRFSAAGDPPRRPPRRGQAVSGIRPCCCQTCGLSHYEIPIICGTQNAFSRRRSRDVQKYVQGAPSPTLSAGMLCAPCPGAQYSSPRAWKLTSASPLLDTCRATGGMHVDPSASPSAQLCATRSVPRLRADWPC